MFFLKYPLQELTQNLKKLDANDPIKYDFALYRLGQSKEIDKFKE